MTRVRLKSGQHLDVDLSAHTLIAQRIEAARRGDTHLTLAVGQVVRLADIDTIVPAFMLDREAAA